MTEAQNAAALWAIANDLATLTRELRDFALSPKLDLESVCDPRLEAIFGHLNNIHLDLLREADGWWWS